MDADHVLVVAVDAMSSELDECARRIINNRQRRETADLGDGAVAAVLRGIRGVLKDRAMSEKQGILRMQSSGRWAVCRPGQEPVEIISGERFRVEVDGELRLTRMEALWGEGYYSIDGYPLHDGMRAAIGSGE